MTLITMVPMDEHAREICLHPETGVVAAGPSKDRLILDSSTLSVSAAKDIGQQLMDDGAGIYIDTPVSGGAPGAEAGTLSFFCGSSSSSQSDLTVRRLKATLSWMSASERVILCGRVGAGLTTKLVNNYIALASLAVAAQGAAFGVRQGLDPQTLYQCVKGSTGASLVWNAMCPVPGVNPHSASSNSFKAGFSSRLGLKDISLAIKAGEEADIDVSMGRVASELYRQADQDPRTTVSLSSLGLVMLDVKFANPLLHLVRVLTTPQSGCISMMRLDRLPHKLPEDDHYALCRSQEAMAYDCGLINSKSLSLGN